MHQASQPFQANGRQYQAGSWVILMDQPFAPLAKELLEPQRYPDLRESPNGPPLLPYDVAGWTLPMQMGVEVSAVLEPIKAEQRAFLKIVETAKMPTGNVQGSGPIYAIGHGSNSSVSALNQVLAAGGKAGFTSGPSERDGHAPGTIVVSNIDRDRLVEIARNNSIIAQSVSRQPEGVIQTSKPRVGLYRAWIPIIDEGWTRWILENYGFAPVTLRNGAVQAGHLRERFDAIIIPDASTRAIQEGFAPGSIPGEYAGGLGESGVEALREFVRAGGTLIAFNNASLWAIDSLGLPVTNVLADLKNDQFFCSGSLLRVELRDMSHPALWGMPREPIVMFERGPAFEPKAAFQGAILASYPKDRDPLASGFLLHGERIQGKAAALEVFYGSGRVYLFGFRPQWRGQSHGTYKLIFNAIYDSPSLARPSVAQKQIESSPGSQPQAWVSTVTRVHADLAALLRQNQTFFAARGPQAVNERSKLLAAVDQFERDRVREVEDAVLELNEPARRKTAAYIRQLRSLAEDLKVKEFESSMNIERLFDLYRLTAIEAEIASSTRS